jgi:hypothetical protein
MRKEPPAYGHAAPHPYPSYLPYFPYFPYFFPYFPYAGIITFA